MLESRPPRLGERRFFLACALAVLALCFAGFSRSYYLRAWLATRTLDPVLQLHGLIMSAWVVLFLIQVVLVATHRVALHRRLGVFGAWLAALVATLGLVILIRDVGRQSPDSSVLFWTLFVAFDGINLMLFTSFVFSALLVRRRPAAHKRLMLLATLSLLPPALGRIAGHFVADEQEPVTKLALMIACVVLVVLTDALMHRRLHPAFSFGAVVLIGLNYATYLAQVST